MSAPEREEAGKMARKIAKKATKKTAKKVKKAMRVKGPSLSWRWVGVVHNEGVPHMLGPAGVLANWGGAYTREGEQSDYERVIVEEQETVVQAAGELSLLKSGCLVAVTAVSGGPWAIAVNDNSDQVIIVSPGLSGMSSRELLEQNGGHGEAMRKMSLHIPEDNARLLVLHSLNAYESLAKKRQLKGLAEGRVLDMGHGLALAVKPGHYAVYLGFLAEGAVMFVRLARRGGFSIPRRGRTY